MTEQELQIELADSTTTAVQCQRTVAAAAFRVAAAAYRVAACGGGGVTHASGQKLSAERLLAIERRYPCHPVLAVSTA